MSSNDYRELLFQNLGKTLPHFILTKLTTLPKEKSSTQRLQPLDSHSTATLVFVLYPTLSQTWSESYFRPPYAFKMSVFMCPAVHTSARS
jgi:hypothetical protein